MLKPTVVGTRDEGLVRLEVDPVLGCGNAGALKAEIRQAMEIHDDLAPVFPDVDVGRSEVGFGGTVQPIGNPLDGPRSPATEPDLLLNLGGHTSGVGAEV